MSTRAAADSKVHKLSYHERPETNLVTLNITDIERAHEIFGERTREGYVPLVLTPSTRSGNFFTVYHGFDTIVVENGKTVGIFRPGRYWRSHFWQVSYLVSKQRIPYHFAVRNCPTQDNVHVDVFVDFLFHVHDSAMFISLISPENMEELLRAMEAENIRSLVRSAPSEKVLDLRGVNCDDMLTSLNDLLNSYGITVDRVTIASVHLPEIVATRLQNTTTYQSKQKLQDKKQELEMRRMNGRQFFQANANARENEKSRLIEMAKKRHDGLQQEIDTARESLKASVERVNDSFYNQVQEIQAQREVEVGTIQAQRDRVLTEMKTKGDLQVNDIKLEADRYEAKVRADTAVRLAEIRAEIAAVRAEREKYSAQRMKSKREHEEQMRRVSIVESLSTNKDATIIGNDDGANPIVGLYCNTRANSALGIKKKT